MPKERTVIVTYFQKHDGLWWANYARYGEQSLDFGGKPLTFMIEYVTEAYKAKYRDVREFVCLTKTRGYTQEPRITLRDFLERQKYGEKKRTETKASKALKSGEAHSES